MKFLLSALVIVLAITVITAEENSNKRGIFSRIKERFENMRHPTQRPTQRPTESPTHRPMEDSSDEIPHFSPMEDSSEEMPRGDSGVEGYRSPSELM